jgi:lipid-A-disaccharide synthase
MMLPESAPLKLFILAGEPSGDRIAADLVARLKQRVPLAISGIGGHDLIAEGLKPLFPMSDLSVMGISDVLKRLPLLLWRIEQSARAIRRGNPDIVVLVDAQDFSALLGRRLRSLGYRGRLILYVAPSVWARAPQRAAKLKRWFDEVLAVLPFEPEVMERLGGPKTSYVGHPALKERLPTRTAAASGPLILLPGSRDGELRRHLPLFKQVLVELARQHGIKEVVVPTLPHLVQRLETETAGWAVPVSVTASREARAELYSRATLALVVSGTATLELALAGVPMVVSYVMDSHQARAFEKLGKPAVSLPNIILGEPIVPELVQQRANHEPVLEALRVLLEQTTSRQKQVDAFSALGDLMEKGTGMAPRQDAAERILAHWHELSGR